MKTSFLLLFLSMFIVDACQESRDSQKKDGEHELMVPDSVQSVQKTDTIS